MYMSISSSIDLYIKDSLINGKVCRFGKNSVCVFVQPISTPISNSQKTDYYSIISKAIEIWNNFALIKFSITNNPQNADITIIWTKAGIKFEGMCKFPSIIASEIRKVTIEIGLPNPNSPKVINNETILHTTLHELGHAMGLGHGVDTNDLMFVPHAKTLNKPSENDLYVLRTIYQNPIGTTYLNLTK